MTFKEVTIDDLGYQDIKDKVSFTQGMHAICLKSSLTTTWCLPVI